jgi:hypothetical protein
MTNVREISDVQLKETAKFMNAVMREARPNDGLLVKITCDVDFAVEVTDTSNYPLYLIQASYITQKSISGEVKLNAWDVYKYKCQSNYPHAPDDVYEVELKMGLRSDMGAVIAVLTDMYEQQLNGVVYNALRETRPKEVEDWVEGCG